MSDFCGIWIPAEVWNDDRLSPVEAIALAQIMALAKSKGYSDASNKYWAGFLKMSERNAIRVIQNLVNYGTVRVEIMTGGRRKMYPLPLDNYVTPDSFVTPDNYVTTPLTIMSPPPDENVTSIIKNENKDLKQNENKIESKATFENFSENAENAETEKQPPQKPPRKQKATEVFPEIPSEWSPELVEIFSQWLAFKAEKGDKYKPLGLKALIKKVNRYSEQAVIWAFDDAMSKNYQGFFPESYQRQQQNGQPQQSNKQIIGNAFKTIIQPDLENGTSTAIHPAIATLWQ